MVDPQPAIPQILAILGQGTLNMDDTLEKCSHFDRIGKELRGGSELSLAIKANALGTIALKAGSLERAKSLLLRALQLYLPVKDRLPWSHLFYNLGNLYMALKDHSQALTHYEEALIQSPFAQCCKFETSQTEFQFNSQSCFAHTLGNLAVIFLLMSTGKASLTGDYAECTNAAQKCINLALKAMPEGEGSEACINMNNVMRQMGCKEEAINLTWQSVSQSYGDGFVQPIAFDCSDEPPSADHAHLEFVCVKYGTKYGANYVNKLFKGVSRFCELPHRFTCFTEDASNLDPAINIRPLQHKWRSWWSKVHIFNPECYAKNTRVFYIDLDMIITNNINDLALLPVKRLATLSTDEIFCENVQGGYNSSIMIFKSEDMGALYDALVRYHDHLLKYLMRFDHFLEMMCQNATIVQKELPGQVLDYMQTFALLTEGEKEVPPGCRVVAFPRQPKPHEISDHWAAQFW